ncbi:MAG TPA: FAD-dependent monooxygenase [Paraburkholderia sp.]|uniref:FAD-dependent oxidoreductase n=1 Tax=Paraburkholderia sp. TaxID=1926495 RepID=UPI002B461AA6|nr:FAD-dependent monooxygenase [Paraburkholderia sp.]HKR38304.1 FAD-dependent monooxygenase [Paraburkholderia sp.]
MSDAIEFETDVLVVGTGPMGAATALALATYGVRVHAVTRWNWLANSPRAHITNQRTVEVFRDMGIEDEVAQYATPWEMMGDLVFATSLAGEELGRQRICGTGEDRQSEYLLASPCPNMDVPQSYLEPVLVKNAAARGASFSFNTEYLDHEQDKDGVTVQLEDRRTGRKYKVRAKYLIGADGGRSKIAEQIGLPLEGHMARAATLYVQFEADLSRYVAHRQSIVHLIFSPDASYGELGMGVLRAIRPWHTWIAGWGFDMSAGDPDTSEDVLRGKIRRFVGDPNLELEITGTMPWYVNQTYATEYAKGRVFCGGDAVHRHPPTNGLGSNTSIQDGFNLAWKLAYVIKGHAGESLLSTYSSERAPVGRQVVLRANQSRKDYAKLQDAFRTTGSADPQAAAIAKLRDASADGVAARQALMEAIDLKEYDHNAHGVELNQRYTSKAVVADPTAGEETWVRDPELYAQASTRPGAKLPHAWLVNERGHKISTLDVAGRGKFTVITGLSGRAWKDAVNRLNLPYLHVVVTGDKGSRDPYFAWTRMREMDEAGALLVRPDGYIAWRQTAAVHSEEEALAQLSAAMTAVLGKPVRAA